MPAEPAIKRTVAFIDGQNLFYAAKNAFGYGFPNYDVAALAAAVCQRQNWSLTHTGAYDVALVFSQDQDLSEVADEIRQVARQQPRWIKVASAFPFSPASPNRRGVNGTDWVKIDRATYDACLDSRDYRPKPKT